jgi:hypothetical protein
MTRSSKAFVIPIVFLVVLVAGLVLVRTSNPQSTQVRSRRVAEGVAKTTELTSGQNLQAAINAANCGDSVVLQSGASWDGNFLLPDKKCTQSSPITIRSSGASTLSQGRVSPSDSQRMARIRATVTGEQNAAFRAAPNSGSWILDGLEITDNAGRQTVNALVDLGISATGVHDIVVQRCYFHQKETGTNYNRSAMRAVWFEGRNLTFKWNYVFLVGYYYPEQVGGSSVYQMDTTALLSVGAPGPILIEDNYINVWWNGFFLGGGDTGPLNIATLTNATTTSAIFSNTTGIQEGLVIRFSLEGVATVRNGSASLTRTSGVNLTAADVGRYIKLSTGSIMRLTAVSGSNYTVAPQGTITPDGTYKFECFETGIVTKVSGNEVSFKPYSVDSLQQPPQSAAWNYGDQGLINDVTVRRNTFDVDPGFAHDVFLKKGYSPKGGFEIKNVNRFLFEGNRQIGYPANWAVTPRNQNGTAPWTTTSNLVFRHNWYAPEDPWHETTGRMAVLSLQDDLHTTTPATNVQIYNNFGRSVASMIQMKGGSKWSIAHNTIINDASVKDGYHVAIILEGLPANQFEFRDNIIGYSAYGMSCSIDGKLSTCWPQGIWRNNLVVDFANVGVSGNEWGPGGMLSLIKKSFSQIGFSDLLNDGYGLSASSPFRGRSSDRKDPGIDMNELIGQLPDASTQRSTSRNLP